MAKKNLMNGVKSMDSTGASKEPLKKPDPVLYSGPRDLTPQELESLRQKNKRAHRENMADFAKLKE